MFLNIKHTISRLAAVAVGGVTFKILKDADVNEATLIIGTGVAAGLTDTTVSIGIGMIENKMNTHHDNSPIDGHDGVQDEEDEDHTVDNPDHSPAEEVEEIDWLDKILCIADLTREMQSNGSIIYKFGDYMIQSYEIYHPEDKVVALLDPIYVDKLINDEWVEVPQYEASQIVAAVESQLTLTYSPEQNKKEEEDQGDDESIETDEAEEEAPDAEEAEPSEGDDSEQFAEAFVEAAETGEDAVTEFLDRQDSLEHIEGSVLQFAQHHVGEPLPITPDKVRRNQRVKNKKDKDGGSGESRLDRKFQ